MKSAATARKATGQVTTMGCDLSLNHGAIVLLRAGSLAGFWYYTNLAGSAARSRCGSRVPDFKAKDRHQLGMERLAWVDAWFGRLISKIRPGYVNIEDYALDAQHGQAYQGEVGGAARLACWRLDVPLRLTDPQTVKMYAALNGSADKDQVEASVRERYGVDFSELNMPKAPSAKNQNRQTSQDLCDAFALAHICWREVQLRAGLITLRELHAKEIQAFNRITKAQPTGLLDREWIRPCFKIATASMKASAR